MKHLSNCDRRAFWPIAILVVSLIALGVDCPAGEGAKAVRHTAGDDPKREYLLSGAGEGAEPDAGYKLLVVLPGGNGSADFAPFVTNIGKFALGEGFVVAQPIAVKWTPEQEIVWPTEKLKVPGMKFTTVEFVASVIADVRAALKIDPEHIYTLSWSSGGPAAYAVSLSVEEVKGSFIAMSVFKPLALPNLRKAKGHRYYIYHSPDDRVCPLWMAEAAEKELKEKGAEVAFEKYEGGHGWHGNAFGAIRKGMDWLGSR